jgi:hypothetical protein
MAKNGGNEGKSCIYQINSEEDLNRIKDNAAFSVIMYGSDKCPGCQKVKPIVDKRCREVVDMVPVAFCPVENEFCKNRVLAYGAEHIPLVVGAEKGSFDNPSFKVEGSDVKGVNDYFDALRDTVKRARSQKSGAGHETPKPQIQPKPVDEGQSQLSSRDEMSRASQPIIDTFVNVAFGQSRRNSVPAHLCMPGIDCSNEDFEDRAVKFLLSGKDERKKNFV